ncbi:MAG: phosphotransferase [Candidatus Eisenbacteria bacterium]|nr:phosphotransferase [Candidatus Eisenbacteria bacterium]
MTTRAALSKPSRTLVEDRLSHLEEVLDAGAVGRALFDHLGGAGFKPNGARVTYLNHKPAVGALIGYQFDLIGRDEPLRAAGRLVPAARLGAVRIALESWALRHPGAQVIHLHPWPLVVTLYPHDRHLPGLSVLGQKGKFKRHVDAMGIGAGFEGGRVSGGRTTRRLLTWKPGRRAVLCADLVFVDSTGRHLGERAVIVKAYADSTGRETREWMTALQAIGDLPKPLRLAIPLAWDDSRKILYQERLAGEPLLESTTAVEAARTAGRCLGGLHGISPMRGAPGSTRQVRSAPSVLGQVRAVSCHFSEILREIGAGAGGRLGQQLDGLVTRLDQTIGDTECGSPDDLRVIHGDFHAGQILIEKDRIGLIDLDEMRAGDPRLDLATFRAHLTSQALAGLMPMERATAIDNAFRDGYRDGCGTLRGQGWFDAAGLALLTLEPYRRRDPNWEATTARIIESAEALVAPTPARRPRAPHDAESMVERLLDRDGALSLLNGLLEARGSTTRLLEVRKGGLKVKNERLEGTFDVVVKTAATGNGHRPITHLGIALPHDHQGSDDQLSLHLSPEDPALPMSWIESPQTRFRTATLLGPGRPEFRLVRHRHGSRAAWQAVAPGPGRPAVALKLRRRSPRWFVTGADELVPWTVRLPSPRRTFATAQEWVGGPSLHERIMTVGATSSELGRVGQLVGRFHREARLVPAGRTGVVNTRTLGNELESLARQLATMPVAPDELINGVASRLDQARKRLPGAVRSIAALHGDLHDRQVLLEGDRPVVIDCDMASPGEAELDVGNFLAHLVLRAVQLGKDPTHISSGAGVFRRAAEDASLRPLDRDRLIAHVACSLLRLVLLYRLRIGGRRFGPALLAAHDVAGDWVT